MSPGRRIEAEIGGAQRRARAASRTRSIMQSAPGVVYARLVATFTPDGCRAPHKALNMHMHFVFAT